jgi:hypothetical protein
VRTGFETVITVKGHPASVTVTPLDARKRPLRQPS